MSTRATAILSLILGLALFAAAGYMYREVQQLAAVALRTQGTVVDFERRSSKGGSSDYPVIQFATTDGEIRRFTTAGSGDYRKGEPVEVLYEAGHPENARVNSFMELWFGAIAVAAFGLLCFGVGAGTLLWERSRRSGNR